MLLAALWILLALTYSTPLWLPRFVSIDVAVTVDPAARQWLLPIFAVVATAVPPSLLAAFTWWWARRKHTT